MSGKKPSKCEYCEQIKVIAARGWCRSCYSRYQRYGRVEYKDKAEKKVCIVGGCEKYSVSHGYCDMHRKRLAVHGKLEPTRPNDWGNREKHPLYNVWATLKRFRGGARLCKEWKEDFWELVAVVGNRPSIHHFLRAVDDDAVICESNWHWVERASSDNESKKTYAKEWVRKDRAENPRKYKNQSLLKSYGITIDDFDRIKIDQSNLCKICGREESALDPRSKKPRDLAVDHCHESGVVRGLLCSACNTAIGLMKDDTSTLQSAIDYLNKFK